MVMARHPEHSEGMRVRCDIYMTYQSQSPEKERGRSRKRERPPVNILIQPGEKGFCGGCKIQTSVLPKNTTDSENESVRAYKEACFPNTHTHTHTVSHTNSDYQGQIMINHTPFTCIHIH